MLSPPHNPLNIMRRLRGALAPLLQISSPSPSKGLCIKSRNSQALLEQLALLYQKSRMSAQALVRK